MEKITINLRELSIRFVPIRDVDQLLHISQIVDGTSASIAIAAAPKLLAINLWN